MFYFTEYIIMSCMAFAFGRKNRKIAVALFFLFVFLFVFRYSELSDLIAYRNYFNNVRINSITELYAFEPAFKAINFFFSTIGLSFDAFTAILYVFFFCIFWISSKYYTENIGIALLASSFFMIYTAMGALRQGICIFLFFYATRFIIDEQENVSGVAHITVGLPGKVKATFEITNDVKYLLVSALCILMHRTALFMLLIYLYRKKPLKKYVIGFALFSTILWPYFEMILSRFQYFNGKYQFYRNDLAENSNRAIISFRLFEYIIVFLYLFLKKYKNKKETLALDLIELGLVVHLCFSNFFSATYRFLQYTDVGLIIFFITFFDNIKKVKMKYAYIFLLMVYVFIRFYRINVIFYDPNWHFLYI